ncbi:unnamed protein product [Phytomonas sp. EM1]|nr:unnamed protein product [Phytomonas sp. EM1]|eukprot:CCW61609.1 unnamed protein product [Phytomonas sp. isolate EM1]
MTRCSACNIVLNSADELRSHYNSEAHILNVGRRVEGLRPLTQQELRSAGMLSKSDGAMDGENGSPLFSCTLCKKSFRSVQTLQAHVRSIAHLMLKEQHILARDSEAASMLTTTSLGSAAMGLHRRHHAKRAALRKLAEEGAKAKNHPKVSPEDREKDADETRCLLCGHLSNDPDANLEHLQKIHDFFIPMQQHCSDVQGLLAYLSRKVNGLMCLVCGEKTRSFASLGALRDHMREADHEKIVLGPEYQEFYSCLLEDPNDVTPSMLNDVQGEQVVLVGNKHGGKDGKKRILMKREAEVPHPRPREATQEAEQRRMILAEKHEEAALTKKEHHELVAAQEKRDAKTFKQSEGDFQKHQLRVNLRSNKLHPKGYDGEGKLN